MSLGAWSGSKGTFQPGKEADVARALVWFKGCFSAWERGGCR